MLHAHDAQQHLRSCPTVPLQSHPFGRPSASASARGKQQDDVSKVPIACKCTWTADKCCCNVGQQHDLNQRHGLKQQQRCGSPSGAPVETLALPAWQHMQQQQQQQVPQQQVVRASAAAPVHAVSTSADSSVRQQQQLQQTPDDSLMSGGTLLRQCSTLGSQGGTLLPAGSTASDLLSHIVSTLEDQVTKAIRPIVSQVIQQKLMQELSAQITHLTDGALHNMTAGPQQQQGQVTDSCSDSMAAGHSATAHMADSAAAAAGTCLSPFHAGSTASLSHRQLVDVAAAVAGSSNMLANLLDTSGSSDPTTISMMAAELLGGEQQQQPCADTPATISSNNSAWSRPQANAAGSDVAVSHNQPASGTINAVTARLPTDHEPSPSPAIALLGVEGHVASTPATLYDVSSSVTPMSPFAAKVWQQSVSQLISNKQQGSMVLPHSALPCASAPPPAAAAAAVAAPSAVSHEQQCVLSPGNSTCGASAAAAAAADVAADMWQCHVNAEVMCELLADDALPDEMISRSLVGTSSQPGPISGNIFDDIDCLEELLAADEACMPRDDGAAALAAVVTDVSDTWALQQQQQQQQPISSAAAQIHYANAAHAAAAPQLVASGSGRKRIADMNADPYSSTVCATAAVAPLPSLPAAVELPCKRPHDEVAGVSGVATQLGASGKRKRTSYSGSTSSSSGSGRRSTRSADRRLQQHRQLVNQQVWQCQQSWQQQQPQQSQSSTLLSQLPSWLTKHVL